MKKLLVILCALALVLVAAACEKAEAPPQTLPEQQETDVPENGGQEGNGDAQEPPAGTENNSGDPERLGETELPVSVEGQEEQMPVILWQTESFSVYVPSEGWAKNDDQVWQPDNNQDVRFFVLEYTDADAESAREQLRSAYPAYAFQEPEGDIVRGKDEADQMILRVKLVETDDRCFAVCSQYPLEAAEGYGARLSALADTFQAK